MTMQGFKIKLCAGAIIAAVLFSVSVITSCRQDIPMYMSDENGTGAVSHTELPETAVAVSQTSSSETVGAETAETSASGEVTSIAVTTAVTTVTEPVIPAGYQRTDTAGTKTVSAAAIGESGDMSAYTSVSGVVLLGDSLYVSDETGKHVYMLSTDGKLQKTYPTDRQVNHVVTDGTHVYSMEGALDGRIVKLSADLGVLASVSVGHTPSDMAIVGTKGYAVNRFSGTVSVIDLSDMKVFATVEVDGREPIAAAASGKDVYIVCHLPDESMNESVVSANVVILSSETDTVVKMLPLVNGASGVKGICVSPDGGTVYVSHVIGRYAYPTTQLDRGWINTNGFSIIDTKTQTVSCTCLLDEVDEGAANPWGITVSADGKYLCVALSGLNEVMVIDIAAMQQKISKVVRGTSDRAVDSAADIVNYLPFLDGCRERVTVGVGVRDITEKNGVLYCGLYFDGAVDAIRLSDLSVTKFGFVTQPAASTVRQGQILWSDANNCYQKWQSCNSCHPDAVADGFNWDNLNDGLGNGKSAKSMLYAHRTPPVMVTGIRANAEVAVAAGMKFIQFNTLSAVQLSYIDAYLKSLSPLQSPALQTDGTLTESAAAGEALFAANCASCHPAPLYTDLKEHNVGSATLAREDGLYDTPTLVEVWRTAPYLHDGSLNTMEEVVRYFAKDLSDTEVQQLADYVRSIGAENEDYGVEQVKGIRKDGSEAYNVYASGMQLQTVTVRRQSANAADKVIVALNVYDKDGVQVLYCDTELTGLAWNSTAVITLQDKVTLPEGGSYTVAFYDAETGAAVASVLRVQ